MDELAGRIAELGRQAHHRGWVLGTSGNFSAANSYTRLLFWNTAGSGTVTLDDVSVTVS